MEFTAVQKQLESLSPEDGLRWIDNQFGSRARFSSSLGMEDQVITYWLSKGLSTEIFTLDTGRLFQETYDLLDLTQKKYKVPIKVYFPDAKRVEEMVRQKGPNSFFESVDNRRECCHIRKVEPLNRALEGAALWITGLRADQSDNRKSMHVVEWEPNHKVVKYNPLLHWTLQEVEQFIAQYNIPVNALHKKGFPSIGCAPCTRAILQGEDLRAGRWWWESTHKECGLHETKS